MRRVSKTAIRTVTRLLNSHRIDEVQHEKKDESIPGVYCARGEVRRDRQQSRESDAAYVAAACGRATDSMGHRAMVARYLEVVWQTLCGREN